MPDREPFVPLGVRAEVGPETFARRWPEPRQPYRSPVPPEPLVRAVYLGEDEADHIPPNARKMAATAHAAGWLTLVSFALGPEINADGTLAADTIWGVGDGLTATGKPTKTKVGETLRPQQPTIYVRCFRVASRDEVPALRAERRPDSIVTGMWLGGEYGGPGAGKWTGAGWHAGAGLWPWRALDWTHTYRLLTSWGSAGDA